MERSAPGLQMTPLRVMDRNCPLVDLQVCETPARIVSTEGAGGRLMMTAIDAVTTACAAAQVGLIETAMSLLADVSHTEALQRRLTKTVLHHVAAASLWRRALAAAQGGSPGASAAAAAAHIGCSRAAVGAAAAAAELLGPSSETDALLRRAISLSLLFGGPALSHERLLERLGI